MPPKIHKVKQKQLDLIKSLCKNWQEFNKLEEKEQTDIIAYIEKCIFNKTKILLDSKNNEIYWDDKEFKTTYSTVAYTCLDFMQKNISPDISKMLINKQLDITTLTYEEMNPTINAHIYEELATRSEQKIDRNYSKLYKCKKCKENKITVKLMQLRGGDEEQSMVLTCHACGYIDKIR